MQMDSAAAAGGELEASEQLLQGGGGGAATPSLAGWLQIEIDTMDDRKRVVSRFNDFWCYILYGNQKTNLGQDIFPYLSNRGSCEFAGCKFGV